MSPDLIMESLPAATRIYIRRMHNLGFTNNQILGHFFVLGAVIATPASVDEREQNKQAITALAPFDHNVPLDDLIGPRFIPQERPIEEFLHWLGIEIDFRLVEIEGLKPRQTLTPKSHGLFAAEHNNVTTMASAHGLYLDFYEVLGTRMNETSINVSEALQIGIFQQQLNFMTDSKATRDINNCLNDFMSPLLKAVRDFGMCGTPERIDQQLDTQIALQGLWGGLDDLFMSVAWPFQSWLFFQDGNPLPGVEDLSHEEFWVHACEQGTKLLMHHFDSIPRLSETSVKLDALPSWGSQDFSFETVNKLINSIWGYDINSNAHYTDVLHYRACLIHCIYSALCKETETIH